MSTESENENSPRSPAELGSGDGALWDDADVAAFLKVTPADVDDAVASGIPAIYLRVTVDGKHEIARRFMPAVVRDHCARRSLSIISPLTRPLSSPPAATTTRWRQGSGGRVQP